MIELRVLTPDDWATWRELRLAALADAPYAFNSRLADWQGEGDRDGRWRERLSIPGSYNVVAVLDGQPVGMVSGVPAGEDSVATLQSMWVAPVARGRGVGDQLVVAVAEWAREAGARVLTLAVAQGNEPASRLYRRHGFRRTNEVSVMSDGVRTEVVMVRPVAGESASK